MSIDEVLEKATEEQKAFAVKDSTFKALADQGWELYFGSKEIGQFRNQFWYDPRNGILFIDFENLTHIAGNLIGRINTFKSTPMSIKAKQSRDRLAMAALGQLSQYLSENLEMYTKRLINPLNEIFDVSNQTVQDDISEMRKRESELRGIGTGSPQFVEKAEKFKRFYREEIMPRYTPYNTELARRKTTQPPHQSSQ